MKLIDVLEILDIRSQVNVEFDGLGASASLNLSTPEYRRVLTQDALNAGVLALECPSAGYVQIACRLGNVGTDIRREEPAICGECSLWWDGKCVRDSLDRDAGESACSMFDGRTE